MNSQQLNNLLRKRATLKNAKVSQQSWALRWNVLVAILAIFLSLFWAIPWVLWWHDVFEFFFVIKRKLAKQSTNPSTASATWSLLYLYFYLHRAFVPINYYFYALVSLKFEIESFQNHQFISNFFQKMCLMFYLFPLLKWD